MKNKLSFILAAGLSVSGFAAFAQSSTATLNQKANTSTSKIEDLKKPTEKKKDIDDEITDARMRATLGSKSNWSFKSALTYSGGSLQMPLETVRPAYRTSAEDERLAVLSGTVGINYRATDRDNISFGTGLSIVDPLHGDITKPAIDKTSDGGGETTARYRVATPYVGWSRGYKVLGVQNISSATYSLVTDEQDVKKGYHSSVSLGQTVLANFGTTKWNGGASFSLSKSLYSDTIANKAFEAALNAGTKTRSEWGFGIYPFLQYAFNDTYSFRTVFGYADFEQKQYASSAIQIEPYQSVGIGISVTRDIYLYPSVQFTPKDIRDDRTNVGIATNINLF
ncbi:MAG: hypothetical protein J7501_07785 [Bdellovibrio sp.]|nr:hypothetical protein [Bdellovibrio sp.]